MKRILVGCALVASLAFSTAAAASTILWTLSHVTFDDGGSASGTFSIDSTTGLIATYNLMTTAGPAVSGQAYNSGTSFAVNSAFGPHSFTMIRLDYGQYMSLSFADPLTGSGTNLLLLYTGDPTTGSWECNNCLNIRFISGGWATTAAVPETGTWLSMLIGFATLGLAMRSRRPALATRA